MLFFLDFEATQPENIGAVNLKSHRDRIMANIMKAICKNTKYCNFLWERAKGEKEENN